MAKKALVATVVFVSLAGILAAALALTPYGNGVKQRLRSAGYIAHTPESAKTLAMERCIQCHDLDKTLRYCSRCGPPLIVVVHNMKSYEAIWRQQYPNTPITPITDADAVAITQVWNALVGNWENTWAPADMEKMLAGDKALLGLLRTPKEKRPIETALRGTEAAGTYREGEGSTKPGEMPSAHGGSGK
ncbi:MAG: hypothetical protein OEV28_10780 [Nitrospirota bacterium]|nr:hypothetical protein [Nitrospirota bacterium]